MDGKGRKLQGRRTRAGSRGFGAQSGKGGSQGNGQGSVEVFARERAVVQRANQRIRYGDDA